MQVRVTRSDRRKKTVQARLIGDVLHVAVPAGISREEEDGWVARMVARFEEPAAKIDLMRRARRLAERHDLEVPESIRWVTNQSTRWGSCTPERRTIRISTRAARFPPWVLDHLIIHELAHLSVPGHGAASGGWSIVTRAPSAPKAS
jgi:predicted metal-dependent hydrolase